MRRRSLFVTRLLPSLIVLAACGSDAGTSPPDAIDAGRPMTAYYIARMGDFYYNHLSKLGYADEVARVRRVFNEQGSEAGAAALSRPFLEEFGVAGDADTCRRRLEEQEAAGIDIHSVSIDTKDPVEFGRAVEALLR